MSEYDELVEGYEPSVLKTEDPGPLTDEEFQRAVEMTEPGSNLAEVARNDSEQSEPPPELRVLKGQEIPTVGAHYVIYGGVPRKVVRFHPVCEDAYAQVSVAADAIRRDRAERYLRTRYRGFLCGEIATL